MRLITSNEQLDALLPNIQVTVTGETPIFDKLSPFLAATEKWLIETFTSDRTFSTICGYAEDNPTKVLARQIVCYEAFRRALPHLDVILTPNGFGIVNNQNIVPASKERINRLLDTLLENRDAALLQFIPLLYSASQWNKSEQCKFFAATMFPNMEVTLRLPSSPFGGKEGGPGRWMLYLSIREKAIVIEQFFAAQYLSVELMDVLRSEVQSGQYRSMLHQRICRTLQAVEIRCLQSTDPTAWMHFEHHALFDIVNTIKDNPEEFPEWHSSKVAELYNPTIFENKKESKGFWF